MDRRLSKHPITRVKAIPQKCSTIMTTSYIPRNHSSAAIIPTDQDLEPDSSHQALELLYELTIDQLNDIFVTECSHLNLEDSLDQELDRSPDCVAERLSSSATGLYLIFSEQHPQLSEQVMLERFSNLLLESIQKGYAATREVLDNINMLDDEEVSSALENCFDRTVDEVHEFCISFGFPYDDEQEIEAELPEISAEEFLEDQSLEELMI